MGKESLPTSGAETIFFLHAKKIYWTPTLYTKIIFKWLNKISSENHKVLKKTWG